MSPGSGVPLQGLDAACVQGRLPAQADQVYWPLRSGATFRGEALAGLNLEALGFQMDT